MKPADPERLLPERDELPIPIAFPLDRLPERQPSAAVCADEQEYEP